MDKKETNYFALRMFIRQFVPIIISSVGLAFADIVDTVVIGNSMGVTGLAAISLSLPIFMIINIIMHSLGIGGSIRFSKHLTYGEKEEATEGFRGIIYTAILISILMVVFGNCFIDDVIRVLGASDTDTLLFIATKEYVRIIISGMPLFFFSYIMNYYLRNDDKEKLASIGFTIGNISDIVLNIVFVLLLDMGVTGAAYATLSGLMISSCVYLIGLYKNPGNIRLFPFKFKLKGNLECFRVGFSSSSQYIFSMIFLWLTNQILMKLSGSTGVAVFDVIQNASFLILYLYDGTAKAMQPLVSTYFGEKNQKGWKYILKLGILFGSVAGIIAIAMIMIFPQLICNLFGITGGKALQMGMYALRVYGCGAAFAGISILLESYYQSIEQEKKAFMITLFRGSLFLIPFMLLFAWIGIDWFWLFYPVTEIVSLTVFLIWKKIKKGGEKDFNEEEVLSRTIRSLGDDLQFLLKDVEEFCEKWGGDRKQQYFVNMAVEELCVSIMTKAMVDKGGFIQLSLIAEEKEFELHIRDSAVTFNPFDMQSASTVPGETFDIDAVGVMIIKNKSKFFSYRKYQGFNTLIVRI